MNVFHYISQLNVPQKNRVIHGSFYDSASSRIFIRTVIIGICPENALTTDPMCTQQSHCKRAIITNSAIWMHIKWRVTGCCSRWPVVAMNQEFATTLRRRMSRVRLFFFLGAFSWAAKIWTDQMEIIIDKMYISFLITGFEEKKNQ